jgi:isochorismate synthase EntC
VLDLVAELHPTPAVGGAPRENALAWLRNHEGLERGWYAGPLGWLTPEGEGEFTVALRSLLLRDSEATLYAGAGIVAGSDPEAELVETRLKLRTALGALLEI